MKLRLTLNIGSIDQKRLGIEDGSEGSVVDVEERKAIEEIQKKGWGVPLKPADRSSSVTTTAQANDLNGKK